ncbi:hypothetical protein CVT25_000999 [Psilocybe cyanescens]|uniref:Uncharacterized protein n=1 Tax=Psilocybe cyanescens TaxID=93625 RepID=A0A409XMP5_PSICY|nr:hypothetical protein CVT25_000999 [Psilocybe cyanescens]
MPQAPAATTTASGSFRTGAGNNMEGAASHVRRTPSSKNRKSITSLHGERFVAPQTWLCVP